MAQDTKSTPGQPTDEGAAPMQARVVAQYIKDMSFENPSVAKLIQGNRDNPNLSLEVNVNARRINPNDPIYESAIEFKAHASSKDGVIYDLEVLYAGLFHIENIPQQALEPFLLINCPSLLFPFLRRIVADVTREGGFAPLLIDPIDFGALFQRRKQSEQEGAGVLKN